MASPAPYHDSNSGTGDETTSTPRWVKVFGIIVVALILLFFILMFTRGPGGRGGHTPFRHFGGQAPTSGAIADGGGGSSAPPEGGQR